MAQGWRISERERGGPGNCEELNCGTCAHTRATFFPLHEVYGSPKREAGVLTSGCAPE